MVGAVRRRAVPLAFAFALLIPMLAQMTPRGSHPRLGVCGEGDNKQNLPPNIFVSVFGTGRVTGRADSGAINCPGVCMARSDDVQLMKPITLEKYTARVVSLEAKPADGWMFDHWEAAVGETCPTFAPRSAAITLEFKTVAGCVAVFLEIPDPGDPGLYIPTITALVPSMGSTDDDIDVAGDYPAQTKDVQALVSFNGTPAKVISTSKTNIKAKVPAGATSGPVTVTTYGGTATSEMSFTVIGGATASDMGAPDMSGGCSGVNGDCGGATTFARFLAGSSDTMCVRTCQSCIHCWGAGSSMASFNQGILQLVMPSYTGHLQRFSLAPTIPDDQVKSIHFYQGEVGVIRSDGTLWSWSETDPALAQVTGIANAKQYTGQGSKPAEGQRVLLDDGTVWELTPAPMQLMYYNSTSMQNEPITGVAEVATYYVRLNDGTVRSTETANTFNTVITDDANNPFTGAVSLTVANRASDELLAVKSDGTVWRLVVISNTRKFTQVMGASGATVASSSGFGLYCYLKNDKTVWCWGKNNYGQVGNGMTSTTDVAMPSQVMNLTDVEAIAAGADHACARKSDKTHWCWGKNTGASASLPSQPAYLGDPCFRDSYSATPRQVALTVPSCP